MKTAKTYTPSSEVWRLLHDAGLVPDQCADIIIEAKVGEVVKIHYAAFAGDSLPKVIGAFASSAHVVESVPLADMSDLSDTTVRRTSTITVGSEPIEK